MIMNNKNVLNIVALIAIWVGLTSTAYAKPYKGAEIFTPQAELYGRFVIRMQAAKASGVISNFFLWKDGSELESIFWEEVDIEVFGKNNAVSWQSNIITGQGNRITSEEVHQSNASFGDAYHTFAMEWTPNQVKWLVDGKVVRSSNGGQAADLTSPAQMRINFWPPGIPEWVGNWNDSVLPLHMFVNWAEYYSWDNGQFNLAWRDDFDYFDSGRWGTADWTFEENRADFSPNNVTVSNGHLVLSMTREGQEGYQGTPPVDKGDSTASSSSSSSSSSLSSNSSLSSSSISSLSPSSSSSSSGQSNVGGGSITFSAFVLGLGLLLIRRVRFS